MMALGFSEGQTRRARALGGAAALGLAAGLSLAASARAGEVLDQSNYVSPAGGTLAASSITATQKQVQTVTAGLTGLLADVDLQVFRNGTGPGNLALTIYKGDFAGADGDFSTP